ncbi:hypothetical protein [Pseudonocardia ammonioxydans]|uniref:hypothetical protein n=1 Tax=Pseudonocardia ammonioxydans TaxID=260086 RepID=UPI0015A714FA|nr:hypothetical protein [Pseudonocardia ammonioxydans]
MDADDLTAPILGRAEVEQLRRASPPRHGVDRQRADRHSADRHGADRHGAEPVAPPPAEATVPAAGGAWLALVVLGVLVVVAMLVLVVLWS